MTEDKEGGQVGHAEREDCSRYIVALKTIADIVAQVPTPDETEFGQEWPMRCDHVATAVGMVVSRALGEDCEPTTAEKAAVERACAWLKSFAKELSDRGQRDEGSPESSHKGAVRALAVRDAADQMSKALLS